MIDLQRFCSETNKRVDKPFVVNGFKYATDLMVMVAIKTDEPNSEGCHLKKTNELFERSWDEGWEPEIIIQPRESEHDCRFCNGKGTRHFVCEICEGGGWHKCECGNRITITIEGEVYIWGAIDNILKDATTTNLPWKLNLSGKAVKFIGTKYQKSYAIIMEDGSIYVKRFVDEEIINIRLDSGRKIVDAILSDKSLHINEIEYISYLYVLDNHGDVHFFYTDTRVPSNERHKVKMDFPDRIKQLSGGNTGVALSVKGEVYTWGKNDQAQLGIQNDQSEEFVFITGKVYKVNLPISIESISGGYKNVAVVTKNGTVYAWGAGRNNNIIGYDEKYKLADSISDDLRNLRTLVQMGIFPFPIEIKLTSKVRFISLGDTLSIAVTEDGMVNYWGSYRWSPEISSFSGMFN